MDATVGAAQLRDRRNCLIGKRTDVLTSITDTAVPLAKFVPPYNEIVQAELHWYEAHGVGKVEMKIKELL